MKTSTILFTLLFSAFRICTFAQPGTLDNTFDGDGKVITAIGAADDESYSVAVQSDGRIVVAGYSLNDIGYKLIVLVRYNENGSLDESFGDHGIVTTIFGNGNDQAHALVIQPDGKMVIAGESDYHLIVVRYHSDGTLDSTFGIDGQTTCIDISYALSLVLQSDGKIVAAGKSGLDFATVRFNSDGTIDNSFGSSGIVKTDFNDNYDEAYSVALQADGKIVVAGYAETADEGDFALARYNSDGTPDNSFSSDGKLTTDFASNYDEAYSEAIQSDGKIVAAGVAFTSTNVDFALARYNTDGTLDNSFSSDGKTTTDFNFGIDKIQSIIIQPDGKILAVGKSNSSFAIARYNANGSLDSGFGTAGKVTTYFNSNVYVPISAALQPDGKIVAAADNFNGSDYDFAIARYLTGLDVGILDLFAAEASPLIYPNPIQEIEVLQYTLTKNEVLNLSLYDVNGKQIRDFFTNETRTAGEHYEELNFGNLAAGNYLLTLNNGTQQVSVKIVKQ